MRNSDKLSPAVQHFASLPDDARMDLADVQTITRLSRSTINRRILSGMFPNPVERGAKSFWRVGDVRAFLRDGWSAASQSRR